MCNSVVVLNKRRWYGCGRLEYSLSLHGQRSCVRCWGVLLVLSLPRSQTALWCVTVGASINRFPTTSKTLPNSLTDHTPLCWWLLFLNQCTLRWTSIMTITDCVGRVQWAFLASTEAAVCHLHSLYFVGDYNQLHST